MKTYKMSDKKVSTKLGQDQNQYELKLHIDRFSGPGVRPADNELARELINTIENSPVTLLLLPGSYTDTESELCAN